MYFETAKEILKTILDSGYEAYFVGGFVRDRLLNIESNDIDITTRANVLELVKMFDNTKLNGDKFSSITVIKNNYSFEITTFRKDISYSDHRHPLIILSDNIKDDSIRRDFTINALYMDINEEIIDFYNGKQDIKNKTIRMIGNPHDRFNEDALRILRGYYLMSKLDFDFEETLENEVKSMSYLLQDISGFRVLSELEKIIKWNRNNKVFKKMYELETYRYLEGFTKGIEYIVEQDIIINDCDVFYALSFKLNEEIPMRYNFDKKTKNSYLELIKLSSLKLTIYDMIDCNIDTLKKANYLRKCLNLDYIIEEELESMYNEMPIHYRKELSIDSNTLISNLKKPEGVWIKEYKEIIIKGILSGTVKNNEEEIIAFIKKVVQ